jgi:hypothetical protein
LIPENSETDLSLVITLPLPVMEFGTLITHPDVRMTAINTNESKIIFFMADYFF